MKRKLSKWERDAKRRKEAHGKALKEANRALVTLLPFIGGPYSKEVTKAHNIIAGLLNRWRMK